MHPGFLLIELGCMTPIVGLVVERIGATWALALLPSLVHDDAEMSVAEVDKVAFCVTCVLLALVKLNISVSRVYIFWLQQKSVTRFLSRSLSAPPFRFLTLPLLTSSIHTVFPSIHTY